MKFVGSKLKDPCDILGTKCGDAKFKGKRASADAGGERPLKKKGKVFSENNMYIILASQMQITIRVELIVP